jgi:pilus assembly protein Flp/PilA
MLQLINTWLQSRIVREDEGATMVEYGLMVALIAVVAIVGVTLVGDNLLALFNDVGGDLAL